MFFFSSTKSSRRKEKKRICCEKIVYNKRNVVGIAVKCEAMKNFWKDSIKRVFVMSDCLFLTMLSVAQCKIWGKGSSMNELNFYDWQICNIPSPQKTVLTRFWAALSINLFRFFLLLQTKWMRDWIKILSILTAVLSWDIYDLSAITFISVDLFTST